MAGALWPTANRAPGNPRIPKNCRIPHYPKKDRSASLEYVDSPWRDAWSNPRGDPASASFLRWRGAPGELRPTPSVSREGPPPGDRRGDRGAQAQIALKGDPEQRPQCGPERPLRAGRSRGDLGAYGADLLWGGTRGPGSCPRGRQPSAPQKGLSHRRLAARRGAPGPGVRGPVDRTRP